MQHPGFFQRGGPYALRVIVEATGAELVELGDGEREIDDLRPLHLATRTHLTFCASRKYAVQLAETHAAACLIKHRDASLVPLGAAAVMTDAPHRAFAIAVGLLYPESLQPTATGAAANAEGKLVHPTAEIAENVTIEPGAIVGREARIGAGTAIAAGAIVGYRVFVGRNCYIGAGAAVTHALIGERVILHSGVRIGQDGFGYAMSAEGHIKIPQVGRVIIGDDVEIGANSTVDRGFLMDTVIGEGTKIDNLVQIAHNVVIGRHCVIIAQSGIAGSAQLGDFVIMGAQSGIVEHVKIGDGAQIAGMAHVKNDVLPGARMGGTPARPFREWAREVAAVKQLGKNTGRIPQG
ncbi:MAG: UDP-3-O-(3-hydroxymyristoyl)glucosamine N-acyltransferase [Methyloceanibacter sp.]|jgi:UDP-3-O-[3-hydroxymyristoyl] glucosamine N-acyltransferase|nr:UDP-3-O-(3-hydroxymyristoyl)glucosamine N-acyltransferase [Methyloceanibacter sp.]